MGFKDKQKLQKILRCPDSLGRIFWFGRKGKSFKGKRRIRKEGDSFVFISDDLPTNYNSPEYESSNPYQQKSIELIENYTDGIVVDLGAGNPKVNFANVCQVEIRKYPNTDIVVTEGKIPLKSNSVDAVISEAVLEHVKNPFEYVSEIYRILKPGGEVLLDSAFMQPLHGYPHHYFNATKSGVKLLFDQFKVEKIGVGAHQHPWIALHWILNSFYNGIEGDESKNDFVNMTIGRAMELLGQHQELRSQIKKSDDPCYIAEKLRLFNTSHSTSLGCFGKLSGNCETELAAGFQVFAKKPLR